MLKLNEIHEMDCVDFLTKMSDQGICTDLIIADPPYNMGKASWDKEYPGYNGYFSFMCQWMDLLHDVSSPGTSLYVFNTPYNCALMIEHLEGAGFTFQNWLTWDKRDGQGGSTKRYTRRQESILFMTVGDDYTFNADNIRIPYESTDRIAHAAKSGIVKNGKRWYPNPNGRLCGDVWHITSQRHKTKVKGRIVKPKHVTPKPRDMIERMVKASSNEGDLVLDLFSGTGVTSIVAKSLNRNYIGCDFTSEYVGYARQQLEAETVTKTLFD